MLNFYWLLKLSDLEMFVIGQVKSDSLDLKQPINNGNRTEWSPIRSVIIRVIHKIKIHVEENISSRDII